ncbi:YIP1 family protein [Streptomyces sp. NBC_00237]|uniref:Yip1 family protein n=1 Tax=Streptomyces sp. NBC_00237 TaxID=2975687 RepID=UPI00225303B3|nr:Yip1 family protein [Streptomyces sp. NBC_00237]MCX5200248.1 YIP1 family protein [Streptomyces sp. NBC_00237]
MAGFRIGRGRDNRTQQEPQRQQPQQQPYGGQQAPPHPQYGRQQWPPQSPGNGNGAPQGNGGYGYGGGGSDEPEYFGDPHPQHNQGGYDPRYGQAPPQTPYDPYAQGAHDPYANNPGHTQAFSVNEDPYGDGNTYRAGNSPAPPPGPRLPWKQLLSGIVLRPGDTFWQMRDHQVWSPAVIVTFLYGMLAVFGFDKAREDTINATFASAIPYVLITAVAMTLCGLILGAVTHTVARQLGGDGSWQPTVGLSMLIMSITDAPRLLLALFLGGDNNLVQIVGWATWLAAGALFTSMVSKSHDLPWPKALGASAIQLIALLSLIKLGTL